MKSDYNKLPSRLLFSAWMCVRLL